MKIIYYYRIDKVQSMEACVSWHKPSLNENGSSALSPLQTQPAESQKGPDPRRCAQPRSPRAQFSLTFHHRELMLKLGQTQKPFHLKYANLLFPRS